MKTVKIASKKRTSCGSFGHYFKYTKEVGVKVAFCGDCNHDTVYEERWGPQCANCREEVREENRTLRVAFRARKGLPVGIPKPHGLVTVVRGGKRYLGVAMQHIQGKTLGDHLDGPVSPAERDRLCRQEERAGEFFDDGHDGNFMVRRSDRRLFRIDFGHFDMRHKLRELATKA